ncbi:MAG: ribosome biogenesis GTPase Der [Bdellovibrionota bacterium]
MEKQKKSMISLVGRPNVGKSTLFNALLGRKQAIVMDFEGVTRDRRFGNVTVDILNNRNVKICDTGGWMPANWRKGREDHELLSSIEKQVLKALEESAVIVQVVDIRLGLTDLDRDIANYIRKLGVPFVIAANKADEDKNTYMVGDFYEIGADDILPVSAEHKWGIHDFWMKINRFLPEEDAVNESTDGMMRVCIVGRPNAGKSTFLNHLVGEVRSVASAMPGTTTDPVDVIVEREGKKIVLVDTAGIRRGAKRKDDVEDLAVMYAQRVLNQADLCFLMIDASDGITSQDSRIANLVEESGCTVIVVANKWDMAPHDIKSDSAEGVVKFRELIEKDWPFLDFAPLVAISAEKGRLYGAAPGTDATDSEVDWHLPRTIEGLWSFGIELVEQREQKIDAKDLKELVTEAMDVGPKWDNKIGDFRQIHQVGNRPPQFIAFVKDANKVPEALRRYLKRMVREKYGFRGNPIRWTFKHRGDRA